MTVSLQVHLVPLALLASFRTANATVYPVGPSQPYETIGAVPLNTLQPGDEVVIHPGVYYEKFVINRAGTAASPIVIRGVPDADGTLPIIDGNEAVTPLAQDYWNEARSLIKIGGASVPSDGAAHVTVQKLRLQNAHAGFSFLDDRGNPGSYVDNAACIHMEEGSNIDIIDNEITGCGNGIFITPGCQDILIEGNYIWGNGNVGSIYEHNTYTEALGITYRYNRFGPLCEGCSGNNLKDRSAGLEVAYNFIEGGNRQLDLVDSGLSAILNDPSYHTTLVYGNILFEPPSDGNRQIVHYGGDSGNSGNYRQGVLQFYHNTVVSERTDDKPRTTFVRLSSEAETCNARNNILYVTEPGNQLELLSENRGILLLTSNWIKTGYIYSVESTGSGSITEIDTVAGTNPGFTDESALDFHLLAPQLPSAMLESGVPDVVSEYVMHQASQSRLSDDLGAFGYTSSSPTTQTPTSTPTNVPTGAPTSSPTSLPTEAPMPCDLAKPTDPPGSCNVDTDCCSGSCSGGKPAYRVCLDTSPPAPTPLTPSPPTNNGCTGSGLPCYGNCAECCSNSYTNQGGGNGKICD